MKSSFLPSKGEEKKIRKLVKRMRRPNYDPDRQQKLEEQRRQREECVFDLWADVDPNLAPQNAAPPKIRLPSAFPPFPHFSDF